MEAKLLTAGDVAERQAERPFAASDVPENYNFRAALRRAVDIDAALVLDVELANAGTVSATTPTEYLPWAGSWWPQSKGQLIFGYHGFGSSSADTLSDLIREDIDPIKKDMDKLSESLRDMEDGQEKEEKRQEYRELQDKLIDELVEFYSGLLEGFDGGSIRIENGSVIRDAVDGEDGVEGFEFDLDKLSPLDKFAVQLYVDGKTDPNPFYISAWEILNHYSPAGGSWWGHCNGWAAAAILTDEPKQSLQIDMAGERVEYTTADVKGLLTESHYSTQSQFYGARYYKDGDDINDLTPQAFHKLVTFFIGTQQVPLVFDTDAKEAVWNYPAYAYDMTVKETTPEDLARRVNINTASYGELLDLSGIGPVLATRIMEYRYQVGSFQTIEEIMNIDGIGSGTFDGLKEEISVTPIERTFHITTAVVFTTDGVDPDHVDIGTPRGFTNRYGYTLTTDENGLVIGGEWDDEEKHPDFAWVPYENQPSARVAGRKTRISHTETCWM